MTDKFDLIYKALDDGHWEKAIRLCKRKEIARYDLTKALYAYALYKSRNHGEALQVAREVCARKPIDGHILSTLAVSLKSLGANEELATLYENAFEVMQTDEFGIELFQCYTRMNEYKKMQLLAQKMYKITTNRRFVYWSVASMLFSMQAPNSKNDTMQMMLGERMIQKVVSETSDQLGAEELRMYIDIMLKQGKYSEALNCLEDLAGRPPGPPIENEDFFKEYPSSVKIHDIFLQENRLFLLEKLGRYEDSKSCLYGVLNDYPDQWSSHKKIVDIIFAQVDRSHDWHLNELLAHHAFIRNQQQNLPKLRGPYLAELYLLESMKTSNIMSTVDDSVLLPSTWPSFVGPDDFVSQVATFPSELFTFSKKSTTTLNEYFRTKYYGDIAALICAYVKQFSGKPCCFADLKSRLELITSAAEVAPIVLEG